MRKLMHSLWPSLLLALAIPLAATLQAHGQGRSEYGAFPGPLDLRMSSNGRDATLLASFAYMDPTGKRWEAPAGTVVNGASIPGYLWSIIGSPWTGKYREASVIHDYYCETKKAPWKLVHQVFYTAMLANAVDPVQARIMYAAVYRFGPRWDFEYAPDCANCVAIPRHVDAYTPAFNVEEFERLRARLQQETDSLEQIEREADAALREELMAKRVGRPVLTR